eukprot:TRINITY_DN5628_c0_g2_i1.p1 TRINITY_DN5628_c0_g2~~TRINITY_DN5628_c0_g2_i1.p1  ORF type:complete len:285 (+),score=72.03 TRINITY_DN5628_c0_g2_i1:113-967(+)
MADNKRKQDELVVVEPVDNSSEPAAKKPDLDGAASGAGPSTQEELEKLRAVLAKLTSLVDADKKCIKATRVLTKTIESSLSKDTAAEFDLLMHKLQERDNALSDMGKELSDSYAQIFDAIDKKLDAFPPSQRYDIETSVFHHSLCRKLQTDDSFRFAPVAKRIITTLDKLSWAFADRRENAEGVPLPNVANKPMLTQAQKERRCKAIIAVLKAMAGQWHRDWAKSSFQPACKAAATHRLLFPEPEREQLDQFNDMLRAKKSNATLGAKKTATHQIRGGYSNWSS